MFSDVLVAVHLAWGIVEERKQLEALGRVILLIWLQPGVRDRHFLGKTLYYDVLRATKLQ